MRRLITVKATFLAVSIFTGSALVSGHGDDWGSYIVDVPEVTVSQLTTAPTPEA